MVLVVMLAADVLGFELTTSVGDRLRDVLPRVVAASIVLIVGVAIAMLVGGISGRLFTRRRRARGRVRGQIVTIVLTGFTVLLALEQLGLAASSSSRSASPRSLRWARARARVRPRVPRSGARLRDRIPALARRRAAAAALVECSCRSQ
jgi:hypothetical protein